MIRVVGIIVVFGLSALNLLAGLNNIMESGTAFSLATSLFCFGIGIAISIKGSIDASKEAK